MELDPHTLQQILERIQQQMRCPQCGKRIPVDFSSVRVMATDALLLQIKCERCNAFIVLHASLQGLEKITASKEVDALANASSSLQLSEDEIKMLHAGLEQCEGSFEKLFAKVTSETKKKEEGPTIV